MEGSKHTGEEYSLGARAGRAKYEDEELERG